MLEITKSTRKAYAMSFSCSFIKLWQPVAIVLYSAVDEAAHVGSRGWRMNVIWFQKLGSGQLFLGGCIILLALVH